MAFIKKGGYRFQGTPVNSTPPGQRQAEQRGRRCYNCDVVTVGELYYFHVPGLNDMKRVVFCWKCQKKLTDQGRWLWPTTA